MMVIEQGILIVIVLHVEVSISPPETPWALSERDICVHVRARVCVCVCVKRTVSLVMYYFYVVAFHFHMPTCPMT